MKIFNNIFYALFSIQKVIYSKTLYESKLIDIRKSLYPKKSVGYWPQKNQFLFTTIMPTFLHFSESILFSIECVTLINYLNITTKNTIFLPSKSQSDFFQRPWADIAITYFHILIQNMLYDDLCAFKPGQASCANTMVYPWIRSFIDRTRSRQGPNVWILQLC